MKIKDLNSQPSYNGLSLLSTRPDLFLICFSILTVCINNAIGIANKLFPTSPVCKSRGYVQRFYLKPLFVMCQYYQSKSTGSKAACKMMMKLITVVDFINMLLQMQMHWPSASVSSTY